MPDQRGEGQRLINVYMKEAFIAEIDAAMEKAGFSDRSTFIRAAIMEKLERMGIALPPSLAAAPSRSGKGGRKKKDSGKSSGGGPGRRGPARYADINPAGNFLNDPKGKKK